tara:strand:- start:608 stop:952 length:345 start_codon:yes stop_codon:yes gene_type:complete
MKSLFNFAISFLLIFIADSFNVDANEVNFNLNKSDLIILNKYTERFCSAKSDYFFEGLDNEKTLKYSYFNYIGLKSEEISSRNIYPSLIKQIKDKCIITTEEESELNEFLLKGK